MMRKAFLWTLIFVGAAALAVVGWWGAAGPAAPAAAAETQENPAANCRFGVNNRPGLSANQWIPTLGAGFYLNFTPVPKGPAVPPEAEFVPQIRMQQDRAPDGRYLPTYVITPTLTFDANGLGPIVLANPGRLWLAGNEPDVANPVQDNMYPAVYARAYHEIYHFIKALDPTAYVANAALSMMTPGRMQYMDIVWDAYLREFGTPMPVDVWNMHLYILSEYNPYNESKQGDGKVALGTDPAIAKLDSGGSAARCPLDEVYCRAEHDSLEIFSEQIRNMRQWMQAHGQQNKPLILSEWSILYPFVDYDDPVNPTECFLMDELGQCFTPARVTRYMERTLDYLLNARDPALGYPADDYRLVQQWKWYSLSTLPEWSGGSSNLLVDNYADFARGDPAALTLMGQTFRRVVSEQTNTVNLVAGRAETAVGRVGPNGLADVPIGVGFYNSGTTGVAEPFRVTFYADAALTQVIGTAEITRATHGVINGCAWGRNSDRAGVLWEGLPVGVYRFWAKVDSDNVITNETSEADNVVAGVVRVYQYGTHLPVVGRWRK
jgi:hypothetical protein